MRKRTARKIISNSLRYSNAQIWKAHRVLRLSYSGSYRSKEAILVGVGISDFMQGELLYIGDDGRLFAAQEGVLGGVNEKENGKEDNQGNAG